MTAGTGLPDDELATLTRDFLADRFSREQPVFARAAARGDLPPDADPMLLLDLIAGAVSMRGRSGCGCCCAAGRCRRNSPARSSTRCCLAEGGRGRSDSVPRPGHRDPSHARNGERSTWVHRYATSRPRRRTVRCSPSPSSGTSGTSRTATSWSVRSAAGRRRS
ncbi:TetR-like C-terminal domain-containing protein [Streptomyces sp. NPDC052052]|uniref:TetR-like C-terminal domain-containing protein n=1 Tax=Streptomyces sp. NPDC052052 TaxID=3154756 RepID=UPI00342C8634